MKPPSRPGNRHYNRHDRTLVVTRVVDGRISPLTSEQNAFGMDPDSQQARFDDVRMRGFRTRTSVHDALSWIDQTAAKFELPTESIDLSASAGRVLAADVVSEVDVPSFRRGMMDGFAVHAADTLGASSYNPLEIKVIGNVLPGQAFAGTVSRGECVRIMTGAALPPGADAVLPAEKVQSGEEVIRVVDEVPPEKHVGRIGEDITQGTKVLSAGRKLRPQDLGVLSSIGNASVHVVRRPRVRLLITGNELAAAGSTPPANGTVDANSPMLRALVARDGGEFLFDGITPDQPDQIQAMMEDPSADIVIVSGGSSVGQEDHAPKILAEIGNLKIHGIAMRPSSPAGMGQIGNRFVFLLPGNPVSCLCAYDFFAGRAVRLRGGLIGDWPYLRVRGVLTKKISSVVGRQDYARVLLEDQKVIPIAIAGASVLSSTSRANGFVVIPTDSEGCAAGTEVDVFLYDSFL